MQNVLSHTPVINVFLSHYKNAHLLRNIVIHVRLEVYSLHPRASPTQMFIISQTREYPLYVTHPSANQTNMQITEVVRQLAMILSVGLHQGILLIARVGDSETVLWRSVSGVLPLNPLERQGRGQFDRNTCCTPFRSKVREIHIPAHMSHTKKVISRSRCDDVSSNITPYKMPYRFPCQ